ncbi:MAG: hypothetical protein HZB92_02765 [Euryarchaeota archaeon]|nr:hypothetical protein [Euryarchaeota archaeon]
MENQKDGKTVNQAQQLSPNHIAVIFHSTLFGYEDAVQDLLGLGADAVIPYVVQRMAPMLAREGIVIVDRNCTAVENMAKIVRFFNNQSLLSGFSISKASNDSYKLEIKRCMFACSGIHDEVRPNTKCPYSLIVAALLSSVELKNGRPAFTVTSCSFTKEGISAELRPASVSVLLNV